MTQHINYLKIGLRFFSLLERSLPRSVYGILWTIPAVTLVCWRSIVRSGYLRSTLTMKARDANGKFIPWFSYPAISYLDSLDLSNRDIFEYGCGFSTLYWSRRCHKVRSVENSPAWRRIVTGKAKSNAVVDLAESKAEYISAIENQDAYDIIVVDGLYRKECAAAAVRHITPGGIIILDDAERYPSIRSALRKSGFLEVPFIGFSPLVTSIKQTNFYFDQRPLRDSAECSTFAVCRAALSHPGAGT